MNKTLLRHPRRRAAIWRRVLVISACVVGLFVLCNGVMWLVYRGRVLPNVSLGPVPVGNISYRELNEKVEVSRLLVDEVELAVGDTKQSIAPTSLGVTVDWPATRDRLKQQRSFVPLLNLVRHRIVPIKLTIDDPAFLAAQASLAPTFSKAASPQRIIFSGQNFEISAAEPGHRLDETTFKDKVLAGVEAGERQIAVPTQVVDPPANSTNLDGELQVLRKKLSVAIKLSLNGQIVQPSAADKGGWFVQSGQSMAFSGDKVKAYVTGLGSIYNTGNAASAISYALDKQTATTFVLGTTQAPAKYTYCAATKGVDQSHLPGFIAKTAAVLGDPRGWSAGGKVAFERVDTNCDFSLWLSAPSQMTSFGGVCDNYYSCRSGRNVVINFDRWQGATDPWNASGGSLEDYRVMVTNHEVGHWLGFGHRNCTGAGQPAPVMQQQSIDLQGCKFNPWPTEAELTTLKQSRGIAMLPARENYTAGDSCCCGHCVG